MAKNYYKILNVDPWATHEEIKTAYRTLRKRYHQDRAYFRQIAEAWSILGDSHRRKEYDQRIGLPHRPPPGYQYRTSHKPETSQPENMPLLPKTEIISLSDESTRDQVNGNSVEESQSRNGELDRTRLHPGQSGRTAYLEIRYPDGRIEQVRLNKEWTRIGRQGSNNDNEIVLPDPHRYISRHHATIIKDKGRYFIVDNNSVNGTLLQGKPLVPGKRTQLQEGDVIEIEGRQLTFRWE